MHKYTDGIIPFEQPPYTVILNIYDKMIMILSHGINQLNSNRLLHAFATP